LKEDLIGFKSEKHKLSRVFPDIDFNSKANDPEGGQVVQKTKIAFFVMLILRFAS
jgi:hypothetical protein